MQQVSWNAEPVTVSTWVHQGMGSVAPALALRVSTEFRPCLLTQVLNLLLTKWFLVRWIERATIDYLGSDHCR